VAGEILEKERDRTPTWAPTLGGGELLYGDSPLAWTLERVLTGKKR